MSKLKTVMEDRLFRSSYRRLVVSVSWTSCHGPYHVTVKNNENLGKNWGDHRLKLQSTTTCILIYNVHVDLHILKFYTPVFENVRPTLKIVALLCSYLPIKTGPTQENLLPFWGEKMFLYFCSNSSRHYFQIIKNCIFNCRNVTQDCDLIYSLFMYSIFNLLIFKSKKKELPTYSFGNWRVGAQQTKIFLRIA